MIEMFTGSTRQFVTASVLAVSVVLAGCSTTSTGSSGGLGYTPPKQSPGKNVALGNATTAEGIQRVVSRLKSAGFKVVSTNSSSGEVVATSSNLSLVNCGTYRQTIDGNTATFSGSAPIATVFDFNQAGDILVREAKTDSRIRVTVSPGGASVDENHKVTLRQLTADRQKVLWSETKSVGREGAVQFSDQTICTSADAVRGVLR